MYWNVDVWNDIFYCVYIGYFVYLLFGEDFIIVVFENGIGINIEYIYLWVKGVEVFILEVDMYYLFFICVVVNVVWGNFFFVDILLIQVNSWYYFDQ